MDSTIIEEESLDELGKLIGKEKQILKLLRCYEWINRF